MARPSLTMLLCSAALTLPACSDEPIGTPLRDEWSTRLDAGRTSSNPKDGAASNTGDGGSHDTPTTTDASGDPPAEAGSGKPTTTDGGIPRVVGQGSLGPAGGTLTTDDDSALLFVPKGALTSATELTLERVLPAPNGSLMAVKLGPVTAEFNSPVTLTLSYSEFDLAYDPARLVLARLDSNGWTQFPDGVLSLQARTLSVATFEPATYGVLLGPEIVVEPEPVVSLDAGTTDDTACSIDCTSSDTATPLSDASVLMPSEPDSSAP